MTEQYRRFFEDFYDWAIDVCNARQDNSEELVARWWTPDGQMVTNGTVVSSGIAELKEHFDEFPEKYEWIRIEKPFLHYRESGDMVVIEYVLVGETKLDQRPIVGDFEEPRHRYHDFAVFTMRDGRIREMREVVVIGAA
jgi:hypothetical protein